MSRQTNGSSTHLMIAATAALLGSNYGGDGMPCPFSDTSGTARDGERRAKLDRREWLVAKAEAKRERKRARDLLLAEDEKWRETTRRNRPALDAWIANALAKHEPALRYLADSRSAPLGSPRSANDNGE